ncbi:hypothetical protein OPV22_019016 [Ensete ventricosum]|uniref:Uncharacterized protein n=1 Tax=Ensete ventricosum TaxID=4639 RepID=A0AAV8PJT6_ENSVE|nr:hypothetical protein OPV22_019016 [Ensete ventricosum]
MWWSHAPKRKPFTLFCESSYNVVKARDDGVLRPIYHIEHMLSLQGDAAQRTILFPVRDCLLKVSVLPGYQAFAVMSERVSTCGGLGPSLLADSPLQSPYSEHLCAEL